MNRIKQYSVYVDYVTVIQINTSILLYFFFGILISNLFCILHIYPYSFESLYKVFSLSVNWSPVCFLINCQVTFVTLCFVILNMFLVMVLRVPETMQIYFVYISTLFTNSLTVDIYMQLHAMCSFEFTSYLQIFFNIHIVNVPQYKFIYTFCYYWHIPALYTFVAWL